MEDLGQFLKGQKSQRTIESNLKNISKRKMALLPEVVFYTVIFLVDGRYDKR